jgi:hypothetical protein
LVDVETIRLRAAVAPVPCNTGGIHDDVVDPMSAQETVQPESIPAGLVTTLPRGLSGSSKAAFGALNLLSDGGKVPGGDSPLARPLCHACGKPQFPTLVAQFKRHKQGRRGAGILSTGG